jgi:hypothetical protein
MPNIFYAQIEELAQLIDDLDVETLNDNDVEQARLELSVIKDNLRGKMLLLTARYNMIAAEREIRKKLDLDSMSDAQRAALAQIIQPTGIDAHSVVNSDE